jgi:signal transduction histidine kinase
MGRAAAQRSPEYAWLLPSMLRGGTRSTRDWVIDLMCCLLSLAWLTVVPAEQRGAEPLPPADGSTLVWPGTILGIAVSVALFWRRRHPVPIALVVLAVNAASLDTVAAAVILIFTVAVHRRFATAGPVLLVALGSGAVSASLAPMPGVGRLPSLLWSSVVFGIGFLWGMTVRSRRLLMLTLRERAQQAEDQQHLRIAQARSTERTRIAREMHDVLAHRISLLSLHAGALEIRPGAPPDEVAATAAVIRASAHQALQDLREVIGVLRDPESSPVPERPQPTLGDLPALAAESRAAGMRVELEMMDGEPPAPIGRTAYRIVQEGLTNARKHAPGARVTVTVDGGPGRGLCVTVSNPLAVSRAAAVVPGSGSGLIGLTERAHLTGGTVLHGRAPGGNFVLRAELPWPPATKDEEPDGE